MMVGKQHYLKALNLIQVIENEHPEMRGREIALAFNEQDPRVQLIRQYLNGENIYNVKVTDLVTKVTSYYYNFTEFKQNKRSQLTIGEVEDNNGYWHKYYLEFGTWRGEKVGHWENGKLIE